MSNSVKSRPSVFVQILFAVTLCIIVSRWFRGVLLENSILAILFIITSISFVLFFLNNKKSLRNILIVLFTLLIFLQFKTTSIKNAYSFTPSEIDQQIQRMNYYFPSQARLGYILEHKKEIKFAEKFIGNFIKAVDFNEYFPDYFSFWSLPIFAIGLFWAVNNRNVTEYKARIRTILTSFVISILLLAVLGVNGIYGPFIVFPIISLFIYIGFMKLAEHFGIYEK